MDLVEVKSGGFAQTSRHPWERARLALVSRLIARYAPLAAGDVVLDVGCGDTFVVESLARAYPGVQFYAVDSAFTPELIDTFAGRMTVRNVALFASMEEVPAERPASLVLLMDVLEHVEDDRGMLRGLATGPLGTAATRFLITVPAYGSLFCSHDRFLGHYRRYSFAEFRALLGAAGLSPLSAGFLFASLVPLRIVQVVRERLVPPSQTPPTGLASWRGSETAARIMSAVLELDGRVSLALLALGLRLPGLSNFAVCRTSA
ncbi:MAG: methyltransferase domain-containing protein [Vicinamibacterales bacterium]